MTTTGPNEFGALLRVHRLAAGLTQDELAERAGMSGRGVQDLERGIRKRPQPGTVRRLAEALGLDNTERAELLKAARFVDARTPASVISEPLDMPVPLTSFIGRERESAELGRLLETERLITLSGPGGVGKTRLALHVATSILNKFRDGQCFVELAPVADGTFVLQTVAHRLQVRDISGESLLVGVTRALKNQRFLLVLDNCEHVLTACVALVDHLLRTCPELHILTTSRERLGIGPELTWRVPPLSLPEADGLSSAQLLRHSEATMLLAERARAVQPNFSIGAENFAAVVQVCRRLDGMPLALELAAGHLRVMTVQQLCERLSSHFGLLATRDRTVPFRQQTLLSTIEWSYALLSEPEQRLFERLSVFAGGWDLEAAEAVGAGDSIDHVQVLDILERLVDKSLVLVESTSNSRVRYRMLETLKQYGQDRLDASGAAAATRLRHALWILDLFERSELPLLTGADRMWLPALDIEHDNLRSALRWLISQSDTERALRLAGAARRFWFLRGYCTEGLSWLEEVVALDAATQDHGPDREARDSGATTEAERASRRAKVLHGIGHLALVWGDLDRCERAERQSLEWSAKAHDVSGTGWPFDLLAVVAFRRGDLDRAREVGYQALAVADQTSQPAVLAAASTLLSMVAREQEDVAEARRWARSALGVARSLGFTTQVCESLLLLGQLHALSGNFEAARAMLDESATTARAAGHLHELCRALAGLAELAKLQSDFDRARAFFKESVSLAREISPFELIHLVESIAGLVGDLNQWDVALQLTSSASALRVSLQTPLLPSERTRVESLLSDASQRLPGEVAESARAKGSSMSVEETIAMVMAVLDGPDAGES